MVADQHRNPQTQIPLLLIPAMAPWLSEVSRGVDCFCFWMMINTCFVIKSCKKKHPIQWILCASPIHLWPFMKVISGYFSGLKNMLFLWGDFLLLIAGITRARTVGISEGLHAQGRPPKCRHGLLPLGDGGEIVMCKGGWVNTVILSCIYTIIRIIIINNNHNNI